MQLVEAETPKLQIEADSMPTEKEFEDCRVVGRVDRIEKSKLYLSVEKSALASRGRPSVTLDPQATFTISADNLNRVQAGDLAKRANAIEIEGVNLIRDIEIELNPQRQSVTVSLHDQLMQKYSHLSDEPREPRIVRSQHFVLNTDISDRTAQVLLDKLEVMYELIYSYYGSGPRQPINCFVVRDVHQWPPGSLNDAGRAKIQEGAGITLTVRLGNEVQSVVYSCDQHPIVQHEAVHAFCHLAFGSTGPVWYAEGMAEMGNYWKPNEVEVNIEPLVIAYLTNAEPKGLSEIVKAGQITGDSWRAYAWRWALCHLLASNPNYADRFKKLGLNMMRGNGGSFESAYGNISQKISFEYDQFVQNFGNGYRVDLCAWDWKTRAKKIKGKRKVKSKIDANKGWQASGVLVEAEQEYAFESGGTWQLSPATDPVSAAGGASGDGRLVGAILNEKYELSIPFELGNAGSFQVKETGVLYLRCRDAWTELADNMGTIEVEIGFPKK